MVGVSVFPHGVSRPFPRRETWTLEQFYHRLTHYSLRDDISRAAARDLARFEAGDSMADWWAPDRERLQRAPEKAAKTIAAVHKRRLPSWSPATYPPGAKRSASAVVEISCLVLDIDEGSTFDEVWRLWDGHQRVLHTTWSHTTEKPKLRLVLPLAEPVPAKAWKKTWAMAMVLVHREGIRPDTCSNEDRVYFLPALQTAGSVRQVRIDTGGSLLNLDWRNIPEPKPIRANPHRRVRMASGDHLIEPEDRERFAHHIGADIRGEAGRERVAKYTCPACGQPSVWFYIRSRAYAKCDHLNTCGWRGPLLQLDRSRA